MFLNVNFTCSDSDVFIIRSFDYKSLVNYFSLKEKQIWLLFWDNFFFHLNTFLNEIVLYTYFYLLRTLLKFLFSFILFFVILIYKYYKFMIHDHEAVLSATMLMPCFVTVPFKTIVWAFEDNMVLKRGKKIYSWIM